MPTYEVTINGVTYDVESDQDLTDAQAYQYAQMQVAEESAPPPPKEELSSGLPTAITGTANAIPGIVQRGAVFSCGHLQGALILGFPEVVNFETSDSLVRV